VNKKVGSPGIFKIFSPKNSAKKLAFLTQNKAKLCKILITLFFEKNAIFCRKLSKIAENCDHNIDPCSFKKKISYHSYIHYDTDLKTFELKRFF
jgi:hypothetical protein